MGVRTQARVSTLETIYQVSVNNMITMPNSKRFRHSHLGSFLYRALPFHENILYLPRP